MGLIRILASAIPGNRKFMDSTLTAQRMLALMDKIVAKQGYKAYRLMDMDSEASSAKDLRVSAMFPDLRWGPGDESDEAARQAEFVTAALEMLPGGMLNTFTELLDNACMLGFTVAEKHVIRGDVPGFPNSLFYENLRLLASESFAYKGLIPNASGIVDRFVQRSGLGEEAEGTLDDVFFYAYRGTSLRPQGRSIYGPAYSPWALKIMLVQLLKVFMGVNAAGFRIGKMKRADWTNESKRKAALDIMRSMASQPNIVISEDMELLLDKPTTGTGGHFIEAIKELCNKEMKKAILYDETLNAEGRYTAGYGAKKVSDNVVSRTMLKLGKTYGKTIRDQIAIPILRMNGFSMLVPPPVPIPIPADEADGNPQDVIQALSTGYMSGLFTVGTPDNVQTEIIRRTLQQIDVTFDKLDPSPKVTEEEEGSEGNDDDDPKDDVKASRSHPGGKISAAKAPAGRTRKDIIRRNAEYEKEMNKGILKFTATGKIVSDLQYKALTEALFSGNTWKVKNTTELRTAIQKNIKAGGRLMAKTIDAVIWSAWGLGEEHANDIITTIKAAQASPPTLTQNAAQELFKNRRLLKQDQVYGTMTNDIYNQLENMINGHASPQEAQIAIQEYLTDKGFTRLGLARTIVDTNFATAYNRSRQNLFSQIEDHTGELPGSIQYYLYSAIIDMATSDICKKLHDTIWIVNDPKVIVPPAHYNCRSVLIPVFAGEEFWTGKLVNSQQSKKLATYVQKGFGDVA